MLLTLVLAVLIAMVLAATQTLLQRRQANGSQGGTAAVTSPAFQALLAAYTAKAKLTPDTEARAVLMLLAVYAGREARGGEAAELSFLAGVLRGAALTLPRFEVRASINCSFTVEHVQAADRLRLLHDGGRIGFSARRDAGLPVQAAIYRPPAGPSRLAMRQLNPIRPLRGSDRPCRAKTKSSARTLCACCPPSSRFRFPCTPPRRCSGRAIRRCLSPNKLRWTTGFLERLALASKGPRRNCSHTKQSRDLWVFEGQPLRQLRRDHDHLTVSQHTGCGHALRLVER